MKAFTPSSSKNSLLISDALQLYWATQGNKAQPRN